MLDSVKIFGRRRGPRGLATPLDATCAHENGMPGALAAESLIRELNEIAAVVAFHLVSATPLSKDYAYQLHSGFIVSANSVLPMSAHLVPDDDKGEDEKLAKATGATKAPYDARAMELVYNEKPGDPDLALVSRELLLRRTKISSNFCGRQSQNLADFMSAR